MKSSVSVVIPTYNRSGLLARAIRSVLAGVLPGDEVLIVDDGSTDDTTEVVRGFGDAVRYLRIENSGAPVARNTGIRAARCPLVATLDDDDEWVPHKLELQRTVMDHSPELVFSFTNLLARYEDGHTTPDVLADWHDNPRIGSVRAPKRPRDVLGPGVRYSSFATLPEGRQDFGVIVGDFYAMLMEVFYVNNSALMVRKALAGDAYRYDESLRSMDDTECAARLSKLGPAGYLDCELVEHRIHGGARMTTGKEVFHMTTRITILRRLWGADPEFLKTHAARYESLLRDKCLLRARLLLAEGRTEEARADLRLVGAPLTYWLVASLPSALVKRGLEVRREMRRRLGAKRSGAGANGPG